MLSNLSNAVFDVVARNLNRQIIIPADNATSEASKLISARDELADHIHGLLQS